MNSAGGRSSGRERRRHTLVSAGLKRLFDLTVVLGASPVWLPLLLIVTIAIRVKLGSPVFFSQERPGRDARIFRLIKFRTMTESRDDLGRLLSDGERLTRFGRWLRSTSLDELPELRNVLRGEMSLVGPRPLLTIYLSRYSAEQARRHEVKPGITGLAQVMGRNELTWDEKFQWDVRYVDRRSFWLDLKILCLTLKMVVTRRGINAAGNPTTPEFSP